MIKTRKELKMYLDADKFALGKFGKLSVFSIDLVWHFEICLRKYEFYFNRHRFFELPARLFFGFMLRRLSYKTGFSIPINCIGPGLRINHHGLVVINSNSRIGKWCDLHQGVIIGDSGACDTNSPKTVPIIGDFCYIGPGAKLYGDINIGNCVRIGANCVINNDVPCGMTVYGIPMTMHKTVKEMRTIASEKFETEFLFRYPEYQGII